jgi:hypothetical protein
VNPSPDELASTITRQLATRFQGALNECGAEWQQRLRQSVSVPVQRQGSKVTRSKPGEPPRKDRGDYAASFVHATRTEGPLVILSITSTQPDIATFLEGGTERMAPRPHFGPLTRSVASEVVPKLNSKL